MVIFAGKQIEKRKQLFVAAPEVVDCDIGGDRALLNVAQSTYFTLNPTASALWVALKQPCDFDFLVDVITNEFEVSAEDCRSDIELVVQQMISAEIVKTIEATEI